VRVLVCGGGIAGLSLAWCLAERGHEAIVVEKSPAPRGEGYMIDFCGSGYDAAERLGLLPDLEEIHYPIGRLAFVDERGRERFALPYPRLRERLYEGRHLNFLRGDLEAVLYARVKDESPVRFGTTVDSFDAGSDGVEVRLSDGRMERVDVLVGADGVHSHVRHLMFGPGRRFERSLGLRTAASVIDGVPAALRDSRDFSTLSVPDRQVAVYPIRGGRLATFFLHRVVSQAASSFGIRPATELRTVYADLGWVVPELLDRCPTDASLYIDAVSQVDLPDWSRGRVTLAGDACQCVSLLAGQGASLAVTGAYVLAEELDRSPRDVLRALARYEGRLKPWVAKKQEAARQIADWFLPRSSARRFLRDLAVRASTWVWIAPFVRRSLGADSLFRPERSER
jgi:2-polyprenyl-6-methoxyphenol hydroxylase-like FAD-dependent oxidoreductase